MLRSWGSASGRYLASPDAQQVFELQRCLGSIATPRGRRAPDMPAYVLVIVPFAHIERGADDLDDRQVRHVASIRKAVPLEPPYVGSHPAPELEQEPRLADAGVPGEKYHLPLSRPRQLERLPQQPQVLIPPDIRRQSACNRRVEPAARGQFPHDLERADGFGLALDSRAPRSVIFEVVRRRPLRPIGDVDRARRRPLLHARGQVHGVTHGGVVHRQVVADPSDDDAAGVQPDAIREPAAAARFQFPRHIAPSASRIAIADATARRAPSSCATGAPKIAMMPSPRNCVTVPSYRFTASIINSVERFTILWWVFLVERAARRRHRPHGIDEEHRDRTPLALEQRAVA